MGKNAFNFRAALGREQEIVGALNAMADRLEADVQREDFTDAEKAERKALERELQILRMRMNAATVEVNALSRESVEEANRQMREAIASGQQFKLVIRRDATDGGDAGGGTQTQTQTVDPNAAIASHVKSTYNATGLTGTNPFELTTGDIVGPLYAKTILSAIGSPLLTGLQGNYQWPVVEAFHASILDEDVKLGDTTISASKLIAKPDRMGIAIPIARQALNETGDLFRLVATQYMPVAIAELMNKVMFSTTKLTGATNLVGPFVNLATANNLEYTGDYPTLAELAALKAAVVKNNIEPDGLCYVMGEAMKAMLEVTPRWSNSDMPVCVDGKIGGTPVFTTNFVDEGEVRFGAFKYAPQGLFGEMSMIVDPYSQARRDCVDFVLNVNYAVTVLRQEAFASLKKSAGH